MCGTKSQEEAQHIQNLKCLDRNECWRKACKDQRGAWTVGKTDRNLKKSITA